MAQANKGYFWQKLNINAQILLLLLSGAIIPTAVVGGYAIVASSKVIFDVAINEQNTQLNREIDKIKFFLETRNKDLQFVSKLPSTMGIFRARANSGIDPLDESTVSEWTTRLSTTFRSMIQTNTEYYSITLVDNGGNEIVKVVSEKNGINQQSNQVLNNISQESYFQGGMKLNRINATYISSVLLSRENGKIIEPYIPLIYFVKPVFDNDGDRQGFLIATIDVQSFAHLQGTVTESKATLFVVDQDGYFLHHPDVAKEWGFALDHRYTINQDYPNENLDPLFQANEGYLDRIDGKLLNFKTVSLHENTKDTWKVISVIPRNIVFKSITSLKWIIAFMMLTSSATIILLIWGRIQQIRRILNDFIYQVTSASQQVLTTVTEQEQVATQQSIAVNQTATTIEELSQSSQLSEQQAENVFQIAQAALDSSESGNRSVGEILASLVEMTEKVEAIADKIKNLNTQVVQISSISQLVSEIANQTNMLSLNAAVEAVRAGEQGKGFGVVATEIRKLADQSRQSAKNINALAVNIQHEMKSAVDATRDGKQTVEFSMDIAQKTAFSFNGVTESVSDVTYTNQQIALNLQQQSKAIAQVVEAISSINTGSQEATIGLSQTKASIEHLNTISEQLQAILSL